MAKSDFVDLVDGSYFVNVILHVSLVKFHYLVDGYAET